MMKTTAIFLAGTLSMMFSLSSYAEVSSRDAWIRLLPPGVKTTAAYLTLTSDVDDRLLAASSPAATSIELHESSMRDGMMEMNHVGAIDLPAGKPVALEPGGLHMMVMGLNQPLVKGKDVVMTLTFEKAGEKTIRFTPKSP